MKFKLLEEKPEKELIIKLWLEEGGLGINLVGEDKKGTKIYIMGFENGKFYRNENAQLEGLETDEEGRIKEERGGEK